MKGKDYVIVRSRSASPFAGWLDSEERQSVVLSEGRRLWEWQGAATLSQMAVDGVSKPKECKFPTAVAKVKVFEVIEILYCTDKAKTSIEGVPVWAV